MLKFLCEVSSIRKYIETVTHRIVYFRHHDNHIHPIFAPVHTVRVKSHRIGLQPTPVVARGRSVEFLPTPEVFRRRQVSVQVGPHLYCVRIVTGRQAGRRAGGGGGGGGSVGGWVVTNLGC